MARSDAGATVVFTGNVRDHSEGKTEVSHLEYEVYAEMVVPKIEEIVEEAASKWPILCAIVEHREGTVPVGEVSVAVAVSSAHRSDAFEAGSFPDRRAEGPRTDLEEGALAGRRRVEPGKLRRRGGFS